MSKQIRRKAWGRSPTALHRSLPGVCRVDGWLPTNLSPPLTSSEEEMEQAAQNPFSTNPSTMDPAVLLLAEMEGFEEVALSSCTLQVSQEFVINAQVTGFNLKQHPVVFLP